jgi:hypothetical protein
MLLFPHKASADESKLLEKGDGVEVVTTRRPIEANGGKTTLGFALTVAGHSKTR